MASLGETLFNQHARLTSELASREGAEVMGVKVKSPTVSNDDYRKAISKIEKHPDYKAEVKRQAELEKSQDRQSQEIDGLRKERTRLSDKLRRAGLD